MFLPLKLKLNSSPYTKMALATLYRIESMRPIGIARIMVAAGLIAFSFASLPVAQAEDCCDSEFVKKRTESADRLIADGKSVLEQYQGLILAAELMGLNDSPSLYPKSIASLTENGDVFSLYESLFQQYEQALAKYNQHRREYFQHAQSFHAAESQPESIQPSSFSSDDNAGQSDNGASTLKLPVQAKCAQLQQLEGQITSNENRLSDMVANMFASQDRESLAIIASEWSDANQLAMQNNALTNQFNHLGLMKTAQYASNVHNLIDEANRDGQYTVHMQAYRDLSNSNTMQNEIFRRCKYHSQFAQSMLVRLAQIRPQSVQLQGPAQGQTVYTALQLQQESNTLDREYANVQDLFAKLEAARKAMPPTLKGKAGNK